MDDVRLSQVQRAARGDVDLFFDQVEAQHFFSYGMFDLESGVHFEEIEVAVFVHEKFDRSRPDVTDCPGRRRRGLSHFLSQFVGQERRRTLFHDFLVAALYRTLPVVQMDDIPVRVPQYLEFDVVRFLDVFFDVDCFVPERRQSFRFSGGVRLADFAFRPDQAHTLAAAAGSRFQNDRQADFSADPFRFSGRFELALDAGHHGHAGFRHRPAGRDLVAHPFDRLRTRADERDSRHFAFSCESGVFR